MTDTVLMATALFNRIAAAGIALRLHPFAVNVGAGDGKDANDPVYPLFIAGFTGLAIDARDVPLLSQNLGHLPVVLRPNTPVFPDNIAAILREARCPPNFEFFKIDIDGFDAAVTGAMLGAGFRPLVVQMEINSEIPPPIAFSVCAHPSYIPGGDTGFFGCSLAYAVDLMKKYDYALVQLDFSTEYTHDALFVQQSMLSWDIGLAELDVRQAFLHEPALLPHIISANPEQKYGWRTRTDFVQLRDEIWLALSAAAEQKHGHRQVPFEIYISY